MANNGMENLVIKINKLQDLFCKVGESLDIERLKLPQIVVIGGQSVGKSSVLENIVGRNFIPRGNDIVTRCPLYLQLINDNKEYGEFLHLSGKIFTDFNEIQTEIENQTEKLAGKEGISSEPISLKLHSSKVLDLTLVDLPGLVEVAVRNQSENISQQIRDVAIKYIKNVNSLILAVSSATDDLANSVSLKLAAEVDPNKQRTIGILTKLDLVQERDKIKRMNEILNNNFYPLKLGHIGVYNMSSIDIDNCKSFDEFLREQQLFFSNNFTNVSNRVGTENLQQILNNDLSNHIKLIVPSYRKMIEVRKREANAELAKYGEDETNDEKSLLKKFNRLIHKLQEKFDKQIGRSGSVDMDWNQVSIGVIINDMLTKQFQEKIMAIKPETDIMRKISHLILNHSGIHLSAFIPQESFHSCIIKLTEKYLPISLEVVEVISEEMHSLVDYCNKEFERYPTLRDAIDYEMKSHISKVTNVTKDKIKELIAIECSYINMGHKDFSQTRQSLVSQNPQVSINTPNQTTIATVANEAELPTVANKNDDDMSQFGYTTDCSTIVNLMEASKSTNLLHKMSMDYIKIIVTTLNDCIPKLVMHSMVKSTQQFLKIDLSANIQDNYDISDILSRSIEEQKKIQNLCDIISSGEQALEILNNL